MGLNFYIIHNSNMIKIKEALIKGDWATKSLLIITNIINILLFYLMLYDTSWYTILISVILMTGLFGIRYCLLAYTVDKNMKTFYEEYDYSGYNRDIKDTIKHGYKYIVSTFKIIYMSFPIFLSMMSAYIPFLFGYLFLEKYYEEKYTKIVSKYVNHNTNFYPTIISFSFTILAFVVPIVLKIIFKNSIRLLDWLIPMAIIFGIIGTFIQMLLGMELCIKYDEVIKKELENESI